MNGKYPVHCTATWQKWCACKQQLMPYDTAGISYDCWVTASCMLSPLWHQCYTTISAYWYISTSHNCPVTITHTSLEKKYIPQRRLCAVLETHTNFVVRICIAEAHTEGSYTTRVVHQVHTTLAGQRDHVITYLLSPQKACVFVLSSTPMSLRRTQLPMPF